MKRTGPKAPLCAFMKRRTGPKAPFGGPGNRDSLASAHRLQFIFAVLNYLQNRRTCCTPRRRQSYVPLTSHDSLHLQQADSGNQKRKGPAGEPTGPLFTERLEVNASTQLQHAAEVGLGINLAEGTAAKRDVWIAEHRRIHGI